MSTILKGKVKWYNSKKGFGFIVPEDGSRALLEHQSEIEISGQSAT